MVNRQHGLGRGLGALLSSPGPASSAEAPGAATIELPIDAIAPNPQQPRKDFDDKALQDLAASLRQSGVLQPVVVRRLGDGYQLIVGGFAAPSFLFMAGMSQLLADGALERKGVAVADRRARAVRRALWLLGVAYAFRVVEFLLGGAWRVPGGWRTVLRVDVLNVIAVSLLVAALLTSVWNGVTYLRLLRNGRLADGFALPFSFTR